MLEDDQVMVEQVEQKEDEQDEIIKDVKIDDSKINSEEEFEEEEKEALGIEFTELKAKPENNESAIDFRWSDIQGEDEEDIAKTNLIESLQKQADEYFFPKE